MKNKAPMKIISDNSRLSWHTFVADKGGCGHIRVIFPSLLCNILKIEGKQINFFPSYNMQYILDKEFYKDKLFVVFQRAATEKQLEFVKFFQSNMLDETKTGMIYEIDDNLIDVPDWNMAADYYNKNRKYSLDMIKRCHGVTASTEHLATKLRKYNKNVKVNLNHLPKFMWGDVPEIQESNKKKRILWTGSANHFALSNSDKKGGDFDNYLLDYIVKTIDKYQWVFVGAMPKELYDVMNKIEFHKWQNIYNYPMFLKNLNIDIGIAPILDIDFNRSKCLVGDTKTVTKRGIVDIKDIKIGDHIWQENSYKEVTEKIKYENRKTIKIKTYMGFELEGTENHRVRSNGKFISLSELDKNDSVDLGFFEFKNDYQYVSCPLFLTKKLDDLDFDNLNNDLLPKVKITERWGRFIGYVLGDGHIGAKSRVSISCCSDYPDIIDDLIKFNKEIGLGNQTHVIKKVKKKEWHEYRNGKGVDVCFNSRNLRWFLSHKIGFQGVYEKNLNVPSVILNSPKSVIKEFLRGLFESDGTVSSHNSMMSFTTKHELLAKQVQFVLLGFNILSILSKRKINGKYYYTLKLNRQSCDVFYKEINFISNIKKEKLKMIVEKSHSNAYKEWDLKDNITEISYGYNDVYDIQVPDGNYYMANGIISHNSNIKALEYTAAGIPAVYSDVEPYKNLTYTSKSGEEMINQIEFLVDSDDERKKVFENDYKILEKQLFWEEHGNLYNYINTFLNFFEMRLPDEEKI